MPPARTLFTPLLVCGLSLLSHSSSRHVRPAQLGSRLENVAETKARGARQASGQEQGGPFREPKAAFHCEVGTTALVTLASCRTVMLSFFLQFYCFLPLHLSCRKKGKKPWSAWGPAGWNLRQRTMVAFLSFSLVQLKKNRDKFTYYNICPLKVYHSICFLKIFSELNEYHQSDSRTFSSPQKKAISNHSSVTVLPASNYTIFNIFLT